MTMMGAEREGEPEYRLTNGVQNRTTVRAHVLLIPHSAVPHITPMVHFAHELVSHGGIQCTVVSYDYLMDKVVKDGLSESVYLVGLPKNLTGFSVRSDFYAEVDREELRCTTKVYIEELLRQQAAGELVAKFTCVIADFLLDWTIDFATRLGCPRYCFVPNSAFFALRSASFYLLADSGKEADLKRANSWFADPAMPKRPNLLEAGLKIPEYKIDILFALFTNMTYSDGVLINTFYEMESSAIDYLREMGHKVLPVGPLQSQVQVSKVSFEGHKNVDDESLQWLDKQPAKSVVYVNFGTTGFNMFTLNMVHELALGLEASQARFLWVLRPPPKLKPEELDQLLPTGFEERVKDRALILRGWAPQLKILEHPSTAGFLMQCGWNSVQESVIRGIPFIGWATYADQPFNVLYAAEVARVGLLLAAGDEKVDRHDISTAITKLMSSKEGLLIKTNAERMKMVAIAAKKPGGSSHTSLMDFVKTIKAA